MKKKLINRILYSLIFMFVNIVLLSIGLFTEVNNLIIGVDHIILSLLKY